MEHLIAVTNEQLQTGRVPTENEIYGVPTENEIYDHKIDMTMRNLMELVE